MVFHYVKPLTTKKRPLRENILCKKLEKGKIKKSLFVQIVENGEEWRGYNEKKY